MSVSSMLNRQLRILPSAVSRKRLQLRQKGWLTEAMSPMRPVPSSNSYSVAGARESCCGMGLRGQISDERRSMIS